MKKVIYLVVFFLCLSIGYGGLISAGTPQTITESLVNLFRGMIVATLSFVLPMIVSNNFVKRLKITKYKNSAYDAVFTVLNSVQGGFYYF